MKVSWHNKNVRRNYLLPVVDVLTIIGGNGIVDPSCQKDKKC